MRILVHLAAPVLTLIGVLISAVGTYLMSQVYHRHEKAAFWINLSKVVWYAVRFRLAEAREAVAFAARLVPDEHVQREVDRQTVQQVKDEGDYENRKSMLSGVYLLFFGFVLQFIGAFSWCVDALFDVLSKS